MTNQERVSITIAAFNAQSTIGRALKSISGQTYPRRLMEVILIDDGSTDETVSIAKKFALKIIKQHNQGTAAAHTKGIQKASGKYVFVLSHDCYAAADWVESVVGTFEADPHLGIVQGQVLAADEPKGPIVHCTTLNRLNRSFPTVAIAYRAEALDKAGRFYRRELSRYGDDSDLAYRILAAGYTATFLDRPTAFHQVLPEPFFKEIKNAWGCYRFALIFKLHPRARKFLKLRFLWGSTQRYLRMLFWPLTITAATLMLLFWRQKGIKAFHQVLWETVFSASLIFGSLRYRSIVL